MAKLIQDGLMRIYVDIGNAFTEISVCEKQSNGRYAVVQSITVSNAVLPKLCFALGATQWER